MHGKTTIKAEEACTEQKCMDTKFRHTIFSQSVLEGFMLFSMLYFLGPEKFSSEGRFLF